MTDKIVVLSTCASAEEAQRASSELNGQDLDGRKITVNVSNPRAPGSGGGRGPGGPRGGGGGRGPGGPRGGGGDRGAYGVPPSKKPFRWSRATHPRTTREGAVGIPAAPSLRPAPPAVGRASGLVATGSARSGRTRGRRP